jgi:protocatechuate 3,4-dioxygenase beta subunit
MPFHAYGPDKGSRACPVCKYGRYQGVIYFVGNKPDWDDIRKWLVFLDQQSVERGKYLKVYFVYGNETGYSKAAREGELGRLGEELQLKQLALTYVPSFSDAASEVNLSQIDPNVENIFILYRNSTIIGKYINFKAVPEHFNLLEAELNKKNIDY